MGMTEPAFAGPTGSHHEVLSGLRMSGMKGKVKVALDSSCLIIEARHGESTNFPVGSVRTYNHHQTHLMPPLTQYLGALMVASGLWLIETVSVRNTILLLGTSMLAAWFLTRQPTLTVELTNGEHHVITGPDSTLMQLGYVLGRIQQGMTIEEARIGLDLIDAQRPHPITSTPEALMTPTSIGAMLHGVEAVHTSAEEVLDAFLIDDDTPVSVPTPSVVNINIHRTDEFLPAATLDSTSAGGGLLGRAATALNDTRLQGPQQAPVHPRSPVDPLEAEHLRNQSSSPFAASGTGWAEATSTPLPSTDTGEFQFLPSYFGAVGTSRPRPTVESPAEAPVPLQGLPAPLQAPLHQTLDPEPQAPPPRGVVSQATTATSLEPAPRQLGGNLSPRGQHSSHTHLHPDRIPRTKSGFFHTLLSAVLGLRQPSRQEQEYTQMYGDPDGGFRPSQATDMSTFQRARLRSDSESQAMLNEQQHRLAGSTGGERPDDHLRRLMDTLSISSLPGSESTLTGDWQREIAPRRFEDLHEVGSESTAGARYRFANIERLDG
jgi:hypothetical protein